MANCKTTISPLSTAAMLAAVLLVVASEAAPPVMGKPGCETMCGNVSVPYPFGMGPARCSGAPGFRLTCNHSSTAPRLILGDDGVFEVKEISLENRTVSVVGPPILSDAMYNTTSGKVNLHSRLGRRGLGDKHWEYSMADGSVLLVTGCNIDATLRTTTRGGTDYVSGCTSKCSGGHVLTEIDVLEFQGFCILRVTSYLAFYSVKLKRVGNGTDDANDDLPVYAVITNTDWFNVRRAAEIMDMEKPTSERHSKPNSYLQIPLSLDWTCYLTAPCNTTVTANSNCSADTLGYSYSCDCSRGYEGNPYLTHGCQDIDECERPKHHGCFSECRNTDGSFQCSCPRGFHGDPWQLNGCVKSGKNTGIAVLIGPASGAGLILLVLLALFISKKLKHRRAQILKRKFFEKNRGKLLQQLVSQRADISERMIISLEELEKATNNFDKARELGGGGHGTVYKGILSDLHVVAIKKPKKVVEEEIEEFINEVAILSQINHRNVVKLYGCCLETEVPMLVYEFISNGTLHDHLHVKEAKSLSWNDRQRIAIETAKSIAYLHSTTSTPIIHRDIKSANILLDDTLTAKVADFGASRYVPMDKSGITTRVQGTIGYMDPAYYYTGRLTEKSDVFGFGVMLVELLTKQKPFLYVSSEGDGLVTHFSTSFAEGKLVQILDPQVMEEGGKEVEEVASLAVACIKLAAEDRPTMRQVELVLESIQSSKKLRNPIAPQPKKVGTTISCSRIEDEGTRKECSRQYSMEQEFENSARYPR